MPNLTPPKIPIPVDARDSDSDSDDTGDNQADDEVDAVRCCRIVASPFKRFVNLRLRRLRRKFGFR